MSLGPFFDGEVVGKFGYQSGVVYPGEDVFFEYTADRQEKDEDEMRTYMDEFTFECTKGCLDAL